MQRPVLPVLKRRRHRSLSSSSTKAKARPKAYNCPDCGRTFDRPSLAAQLSVAHRRALTTQAYLKRSLLKACRYAHRRET